ncbi:MAG: hypothetical protein JW781_04110, partial [Deltaproteobacteria bacterium]|nr:hypothetical protein [Candidatus Anaeroferrophillacea bacterium]
VNGSRDIDISSLSSRVMVASIDYPAGLVPPRFQPFSLWGSTVTLLGDDMPDGSDARVWYGRLHVLDVSGTTIPALHHDIVAGGACGHAALAWAVNAVNRINTGGTGTAADYLAWGREQLAMFRAELRRLGRRRRLRTGVLFQATPAKNSQVATM